MKKKKATNPGRNFGILFSIVFVLYGVWPILQSNEPRVWSLIIGAVFLTFALLYSKVLIPFNNIWIKFGELLGKVISPIVMAFVYFLSLLL